MGRALIVSAGANSNEYLSTRLAEMGWTVTDTAQGPKVSKA